MSANFSPSQVADPASQRNFSQVASVFNPLLAPGAVVLVTTFLNGWAALAGPFQLPGFRIWPSGEVELVGGLTGGSSGLAAFFLTSHPNASRQWGVGSWSGAAPVAAMVRIDPNGAVVPVVNSNAQVFLDGIRFLPGT